MPVAVWREWEEAERVKVGECVMNQSKALSGDNDEDSSLNGRLFFVLTPSYPPSYNTHTQRERQGRQLTNTLGIGTFIGDEGEGLGKGL